jgi:hypothetical protein
MKKKFKNIYTFDQHTDKNFNISDVCISDSDLYELIRNFISFSDSKICKHKVAIDILNLIEKSGNKISDELVRSIINADDETTLELLKKY